MMRNLLLRYGELIRQIILYGLIGGVSATTDSVVFYLLKQHINMYASNFISINVGIALSYLLNTFINFKVTDKLLKRAFSFFSVGYIGLLLSMLILFIGVDLFAFSEMYVKIFSVFIVAVFQFILNKLITFRKVGENG